MYDTRAAPLMALIRVTETGFADDRAYDTLYDHGSMPKGKKPTACTLDEIELDGPRRTKAYGSSAAGAYQFMRDTLDKPGTLLDIEGEMGLSGGEKFDKPMQDSMAFHLLKRRGWEKFIGGSLSVTDFGNNLAKEWASFPVLANIKGQKRDVTRGQSYYAGDGKNKALIAPETVENCLRSIRSMAAIQQLPPLPPTVPTPAPTQEGVPQWVVWAIVVALVGGFVLFKVFFP